MIVFSTSKYFPDAVSNEQYYYDVGKDIRGVIITLAYPLVIKICHSQNYTLN